MQMLELDGKLTNISSKIIDFGTKHPNGSGLEIIVNHNKSMTYVMNNLSDTIAVVTDKGEVQKFVQVGESPNNIALDTAGNKMYVTSDADTLHPLVVIDLDLPSDSIGVGTNPSGIAIDPQTHLVYVSNFGSNDISVVEDVVEKNGSKLKVREKISLDNASVRVEPPKATTLEPENEKRNLIQVVHNKTKIIILPI